ncbi:diguanylate cyclase [Fusibacter bizertensis]|uniref:Stage 0 sporulation protein A homolog n=1 Tax=Fusibacter bizertensis TaxID=1488331 RepID=A0ABT6NF14_9FIRM|nr:diguanylate cyclase [Fusibacter bizertensis]MDH8679011.1 diguanylate cyclase [Fusibacter bizertensis]
MKALHVYTKSSLKEVLTNSIELKKGTYVSIHKDEIKDFHILEVEYNLIILENDGITPDCEDFLLNIIKQSKVQVSVIVITDICDFNQKSRLYDMGVMAIMNHNNFEINRFNLYLDTVLKIEETVSELKNIKIAVVDDSRFSLEIIRGFFKRIQSNQVDYFQSADELVTHTKGYDLFIVDLVMPDINGEEIIYRVKQSNPDAIIILITSYSEGRAIQHCLSIGANDFILKPLDFKMFILRIYVSISNYRLHKENAKNSELLYELATKDSLTKVYNRNYFIESLRTKAIEAQRTSLPFSLILLDLDNFKQINDEYGHLKGDVVLIQTSKVLTYKLRESDIICRWGGEEFCMLLPNTTREDAIKVAEKIRAAIEEMHIEGVRPITVSLGVTIWQPDDNDASVFKRLDNSLYLAKLTGKNKVVSNEELIITNNNKPVAVEWGPFFRSGNAQIDTEHQKLIQLSNDIISKCFDDDNYEITLALFEELIDDTVEHFRNEEKTLEQVGYANLQEHKDIHKNLIERTLFMQKGLLSKKLTPIQVAKYVIQDVVIGHIIKSDFDYYDCFR